MMNDLQIGSIITFGDYNWLILDKKEDAILIITEDIVELSVYHNVYKEITWAECWLRSYLNGPFFNRFSEADRARIKPVINKNKDNEWFGAKGGEDTEDKIFLLSIEEVACKYFGDSSYKLYNRTPKQNYWLQRKDENNRKRSAKHLGCLWWWWLRSPGRFNVRAAYIHGDGNIGIQGNNVYRCNISSCFHPINGDNRGGVRPALWLKINE